ncbi:MAG: hypothetical protein H6719_02625 [Sandaracinaceae bacterium]|nr:hypothetical protein [Sandaracinaceae bacterium]
MNEGLDFDTGFDPVDPETWREHVEAGLRGAGLDSLRGRVEGGLLVEPLMGPADVPAQPVGAPGAPPFVRGARTAAGWRLVHPIDAAEPGDVVDAARAALALEAGAVHLAERACARLDRASVEGIGGPVILDPGADAIAWLPVAEAVEGVELRFDPLAVLARSGELPYDRAAATRWLSELAPGGRRVLVDATPHHDAGATPADELGYALAAGVEYLRALGEAGHALADAPRRMGFALACDADVFLTIAKLRAARLCWSKILRATGIDGAGHGMVVHAFESRRTQTSLDPVVGALRGVSAAVGAIVGGAEDVTLLPYEDGRGAERLAINTQHVLRAESHLDRVADPAGGAYYVEALTDRVARAAWASLGEIEAKGGAWDAVVSGRLAEACARSAEARIDGIRTRSIARVGVNRYAADQDPVGVAEASPVAPDVSAERAPKALRDAFREAPRGGLADALRASDAAVSVLRHEVRRAPGETSAPPLRPLREAAPFEALRAAAAALPEPRRRALVVGVGALEVVKPRMDFARDALLCGGLRVEMGDVAAELALPEAPPPTVILCTTASLAPLVEASRAAGVERVLVAGPDEPESGVDGRLHRDMDAVEVLGALLDGLREGPVDGGRS